MAGAEPRWAGGRATVVWDPEDGYWTIITLPENVPIGIPKPADNH